jgi:hypothetical protein
MCSPPVTAPPEAASRNRKAAALLRRQPVPEAHADPAHPFHATDTRCQFGTEEACVGSLVGDAPNGGEPEVARGRRIATLFEGNPVPEHDGCG